MFPLIIAYSFPVVSRNNEKLETYFVVFYAVLGPENNIPILTPWELLINFLSLLNYFLWETQACFECVCLGGEGGGHMFSLGLHQDTESGKLSMFYLEHFLGLVQEHFKHFH